MSESLEELSIIGCESIRWIEFNGVASLRFRDPSVSSFSSSVRKGLCLTNASKNLKRLHSVSSFSSCEQKGLCLTNASENLKKLHVKHCTSIREIRAPGQLLSLQDFYVEGCQAMEKLGGISELKNLHRLGIYECSRLQVVAGLAKLEFLIELDVYKCPSLKKLLDIRYSKIQDKCQIRVGQCSQWLDSSSEGHIPFKRYKQAVLDGQRSRAMATARNLRQTSSDLIPDEANLGFPFLCDGAEDVHDEQAWCDL